MKILLTGGSSGGHFYPLIAVAQAIREQAVIDKLIPPVFYYMSHTRYNPRVLFDNEIEYVYAPAGKIRRYFSILNLFDGVKTFFGCLKATISMYRIFPDVVFAKGGHDSFPALFAAKLLHIPVIIHESDSKPGRVNTWAGKFAKKIAVSYPDAAKYFSQSVQDKIAYTGNPIRKEIIVPLDHGAYEFFKFERDIPTIFVIGGSLGSARINEVLIEAAPSLLERYNIIHQTGRLNFAEVKKTMDFVLTNNTNRDRYRPFDYLNDLAIRMSAGAASVVISRAGSTIFEIAAWGAPSILIPIPEEVSHDQTTNALAYARKGACIVIEEKNLTPHILISEITRLMENPAERDRMKQAAKAFARLDAANLIAKAILAIGLEHEI